MCLMTVLLDALKLLCGGSLSVVSVVGVNGSILLSSCDVFADLSSGMCVCAQ